jgi:hypothetical protein
MIRGLVVSIGFAVFVAGFVANVPAALAQDPKFEYGKKEEVKAVEWKASAQVGFILNTGNSRSAAFSAGATASRKAGDNKLSAEAAAAYARSEIRSFTDANMNNTVGPGEISRLEDTTTKNWNLKLRYDRFFTPSDAGYVSARVGADEIAGKEIVGGGQIGYSRTVFKNETHEILAEAGYDFSHEGYVAETVDALNIHSARIFAGYTAKLSDVTGFLANAELLLNLNTEDGPTGDIGPGEDARLLARTALTTKVLGRMDLRVAFTAKFDNAPAPLPPFSTPFDAGFVPLAEELDLTTEVALISIL